MIILSGEGGNSIDYMWKQICEPKHKQDNDSIMTILECTHRIVKSCVVKESSAPYPHNIYILCE